MIIIIVLLSHHLISCCFNLKERGPGRNLISEIKSGNDIEDELKLDDGQGTGKSIPTEMSVSLYESESESILKLEIEERLYKHCYYYMKH